MQHNTDAPSFLNYPMNFLKDLATKISIIIFRIAVDTIGIIITEKLLNVTMEPIGELDWIAKQ